MLAVSNDSVVDTRLLVSLNDQVQTFLVPLTVDDDRSHLVSGFCSLNLGLR